MTCMCIYTYMYIYIHVHGVELGYSFCFSGSSKVSISEITFLWHSFFRIMISLCERHTDTHTQTHMDREKRETHTQTWTEGGRREGEGGKQKWKRKESNSREKNLYTTCTYTTLCNYILENYYPHFHEELQ